MVPLAFARGLTTPPGKSDDPGVSRSTPPVLHGDQSTPLHGAHAKLSSPPQGTGNTHKDDPAGLLKCLVRHWVNSLIRGYPRIPSGRRESVF